MLSNCGTKRKSRYLSVTALSECSICQRYSVITGIMLLSTS